MLKCMKNGKENANSLNNITEQLLGENVDFGDVLNSVRLIFTLPEKLHDIQGYVNLLVVSIDMLLTTENEKLAALGSDILQFLQDCLQAKAKTVRYRSGFVLLSLDTLETDSKNETLKFLLLDSTVYVRKRVLNGFVCEESFNIDSIATPLKQMVHNDSSTDIISIFLTLLPLTRDSLGVVLERMEDVHSVVRKQAIEKVLEFDGRKSIWYARSITRTIF